MREAGIIAKGKDGIFHQFKNNMKYKYLKITGYLIFGKNEITKEDLINLKNEATDALINLETMQEFDVNKNEWVDIRGDK